MCGVDSKMVVRESVFSLLFLLASVHVVISTGKCLLVELASSF